MKRRLAITIIIVVTVIGLPSLLYLYMIGFFEREYEIDIERVWETDDERTALVAAEKIDYYRFLNKTRYGDGNISEGSQNNFIDDLVIRDGKDFVAKAKRSWEIGSFEFEYNARSSYLEELTLKRTVNMTLNEVRLEIEYPGMDRIDSFWGTDPPFSGVIPIDPTQNDRYESAIFDKGLLGTDRINRSCSIHDVYLIVMLSMTSCNKKIDIGGGNGIEQFVILGEDLVPILIIANKIGFIV